MKAPFATTLCRALTALVCSLGVLMAPLSAGVDCRAASIPAKCRCCKNPESGCCAAKEHQPEKPVPVAPVKTASLRDVAPAPVTVLAVLPPFAPCAFPETSSGAAERAPHVALHSFLCIRTV
jgi:hypothetical protein